MFCCVRCRFADDELERLLPNDGLIIRMTRHETDLTSHATAAKCRPLNCKRTDSLLVYQFNQFINSATVNRSLSH